MRRPKPPVSAWIIRERKRLGLKPVDLARQLTAMGLVTAEGTPRTWEAGRAPSADNIEGLERIFGTTAPGNDVQPDLASALSELAAELRATREEREGLEIRLRAVEAELESLRAQRAGEGSPGPSVPDGTAG